LDVGDTDGSVVVGLEVGALVGEDSVRGPPVGKPSPPLAGLDDGALDGLDDGALDGISDGLDDGLEDGALEGAG